MREDMTASEWAVVADRVAGPYRGRRTVKPAKSSCKAGSPKHERSGKSKSYSGTLARIALAGGLERKT